MSAANQVLKPDHTTRRRHFIFTEEHERLRESIHAFVTKELQPHAEEWEERTFDDWVFPRMGELGLLGLSMPEEYGGQGGDYPCNLVLAEELVHAHCGGLAVGLAVHTDMATPPGHPRRSFSAAPRSRSSSTSRRRSAARRSRAWGSPSPTRAATSPASA